MGMQQKEGGASALNPNLVGKNIFLAGSPFSLVRQCFSRVVTGVGVLKHQISTPKQPCLKYLKFNTSGNLTRM